MKHIVKAFGFIIPLLLFTTLFFLNCDHTGKTNSEKAAETQNTGIEVLTMDLDKASIPEGIVIHQKSGDIFISSIYLDRISRSDAEGKNSSIILNADHCGYSAGVGMELYGDQLYALGSYNREKQSVLIIKDLNDLSNENLKCHFFDSDEGSYFNDLAIDKEGNAYLTDTERHKVYRFNKDEGTIMEYITHEQIQYPNGIAISADGTKLFVDSWTHGVRIVDIETRAILNQPHEASTTKGIDGLKYYKGNLYAVVNGLKDASQHGLYKLILNSSEEDIMNMEKVFIGHPKLNVPTTMAIHDGHAFVLANSQMENLNQEKNAIIDRSILTDTYLLKVRLD